MKKKLLYSIFSIDISITLSNPILLALSQNSLIGSIEYTSYPLLTKYNELLANDEY